MMESRSAQATEAANALLYFVNDLGSDDLQFVEAICRSHRTLQQSVMRLFVQLAKRMAQNPTDKRNEAAVQLAKRITELTKDFPLPLI